MAQWLNKDFFKKIYLIFSPRYVLPKLELESLLMLDASVLKSHNINACILDVNQTLLPYDTDIISSDIIKQLKELSLVTKFCILSNYIGHTQDDPTELRSNKIREQLDFIPIIRTVHKKPSKDAFLKAVEILNIEPSQIAVIGDRIFTDIVGANLCGMFSILVKPIKMKSDPLFYVAVPRFIETMFFYLFKLIYGEKWKKLN